jgi:hypothetical protein
MNSYILRSKPHDFNREDEFLAGKISIGWPCGVDLEGKDRSAVSAFLHKRYHKITETAVSMVMMFLSIPVNSIILTPSVNNRNQIHVFRTITAYRYIKEADNDEIGNPHTINIEHLKTITRDSLPVAVLRSLSGAKKTLSRISQHSDLLNDFIESGFDNDVDSVSPSICNKEEALKVLQELLSSEDESIRLQAALGILNQP